MTSLEGASSGLSVCQARFALGMLQHFEAEVMGPFRSAFFKVGILT